MRSRITALLSVICILAGATIASLAIIPCAQSVSMHRDFWLACPDILIGSPSDCAQIIIESEAPTDFTISFAADSWSETVSPGSPVVWNLPESWVITSNMEVEDKGIHVTSVAADLWVQFRVPQVASNNDDMYWAIPTGLLGTDYYVLSYTAMYLGHPEPSQFVIIATQDDTNVTIDSEYHDLFFVGLERGQTYQYQILGGDVTGTHIMSDKPIAVIAGIKHGYLPITAPAAETIFEQMIPVRYWGKDYYTAPLLSPDCADRIRIIASQHGTRVWIYDGVTLVSDQLDYPGEWLDIDVEEAAHITSDKPIGVAQYAKGYSVAGKGDPFEMLIIPTDKFRDDYRFYIPDGYDVGDPNGGAGSYVTIIALTWETALSVEVDGALMDGDWYRLPDVGRYVKKRMYPGEHTITADSPIGVQLRLRLESIRPL